MTSNAKWNDLIGGFLAEESLLSQFYPLFLFHQVI